MAAQGMPRACLLALVIATALPLVLTGCYTEGGPGMSLDQHTYVSTSWNPWTVTVVDTRTGDAFWSVDVPVGQRLVIEFYDDQGVKGNATPDLLKWELMDRTRSSGELTNKLAVPPAYARRIDTVRRATPELPPEMEPPAAPASKPPG